MSIFSFVTFDIALSTKPQDDGAFPFIRCFVLGMCVILESAEEANPSVFYEGAADLDEVTDFVVSSVVGGRVVLDGIGFWGFWVEIDVRNTVRPFPFRFGLDCFSLPFPGCHAID
jgi:hypothetical protein